MHIAPRLWIHSSFLLLLLLAEGCVTDSAQPADGGSGGSGGGRGLSTLVPPPAPPTSDVPKPTGTAGSPGLKVLPWAGFKTALTYSFDDSQPSQVEHWPELQATGVPLTFFVNPSQNGQAGYDAHWTAVAAAGCEIGNHTWNHCRADLSSCSVDLGSQNEEIDQTTTYITSKFGVTAVYSFASPYGDSGWNTYASSRFLAGRGVLSGTVPPAGVADWYNLPVFAVAAGQTVTDFNAGIDNARSLGNWNIFLFHSLLPTSNNWYAGVDIGGVTASIAYAQSLGDIWLGTFADVSAYVRAQQMFEKITPSANAWTWTLPDHMPPGKVLRVTVDGGNLSQGATRLIWDSHGYYEVALDVGSLTWSP